MNFRVVFARKDAFLTFIRYVQNHIHDGRAELALNALQRLAEWVEENWPETLEIPEIKKEE